MKRVETIIGSEKVLAANEALKMAGVGGCTILDAKGRGKGEKPMLKPTEEPEDLPLNFQSEPIFS